MSIAGNSDIEVPSRPETGCRARDPFAFLVRPDLKPGHLTEHVLLRDVITPVSTVRQDPGVGTPVRGLSSPQITEELVISFPPYPGGAEIPLTFDDDRTDLDVDALAILGRCLQADAFVAKVEATVEEHVANVGLNISLGLTGTAFCELAEAKRKIEARHLISRRWRLGNHGTLKPS